MIAEELSAFRKWAITACFMLVTVMQILDTSITNVALGHIQGALSAGADEVTWVLTLYLAANAVVIPATGWLTAMFGRRRLFLGVTALFMSTSLLAGVAPNLDTLILARVLQGLGAGPVIPLSQAVLWEIFPFRQRGIATAVWGMGVMLGPILGPTVGGWVVDNWSWRWIFYINLPIGLVALGLGSVFVHDAPYLRPPRRVDWAGLGLMTVGFGALQFFLDRGERLEWFASGSMVLLAAVAGAALVAFVVRQLVVDDPILDLSVFGSRNFSLGAVMLAGLSLSFNAGMLMVALFSQQHLGYDAWTSGTVLAPAGLGNMVALLFSGRLSVRMDQRLLLVLGCGATAVGALAMSRVWLGIDHWSLVWPRLLQGFGAGFLFVPLTTLAIGTVPRQKLANATASFNVIRNLGASFGIALMTTLLARRSQYHQSVLVAHATPGDPQTAERLGALAAHLAGQGMDAVSAARGATALLYRETVTQARVLAFADGFLALAMLAVAMFLFIPFLRRVRASDAGDAGSSQAAAEV